MNIKSCIKIALVSVSMIIFVGCAEDDEAKELGFNNANEMKEIHAKGWHTKQRYNEDRAKAAGFSSVAEMKNAEEAKRKEEEVRRKEQELAAQRESETAERLANTPSAAAADPSALCKATKLLALKASEPYFLNLLKGARGMSVPGYRESEAATKSVALACGIKNYSASDLIDEAKLTPNGFVLK
jgi:hypothetical protein